MTTPKLCPDISKPVRSGKSSSTLVIVIVLLLLVGLPVCTCGGCVATIFFGVSAAIKSSEPYERALAEAQNSAEVRDLIGEPVSAGFLVSGSINVDQDGGECDIQVPISGPKGSGTVRIRGTRQGGTWTYQEIAAEINGQTVNLAP